ncbi:hypothetical protein [Microbispora sp. GKU 823]|uniref:hypothetical protein n=1 Tax=Microbispora sp. GKU 823 TaxID=1652100 RepID=UPI0009A394F3|nr:hypothetical protein [Microbispora sp. GKU 823]OPG03731.1 hypothetical protein B1L11_39430 [Microbispora sp. GKU 823]
MGLLLGEPEVVQQGVFGLARPGGQHLGECGSDEEVGAGGGLLVQPEAPADQGEGLFGAAAYVPGAGEADDAGFA